MLPLLWPCLVSPIPPNLLIGDGRVVLGRPTSSELSFPDKNPTQQVPGVPGMPLHANETFLVLQTLTYNFTFSLKTPSHSPSFISSPCPPWIKYMHTSPTWIKIHAHPTYSRLHFILPAWGVEAQGHHKGESNTSESQLASNIHTTNFAPDLYALTSEPTGSFSFGIGILGVTLPLSLAILQLTQLSLRHRASSPRSSLIHRFPSHDSWVSFSFFEICLLLFNAYKGFACMPV